MAHSIFTRNSGILLSFQIVCCFSKIRIVIFIMYLDVSILSRHITKIVNLKIAKELAIWNRGSNKFQIEKK